MTTTTVTAPQTILDFLIANEETKRVNPNTRVMFGVTSRITVGDTPGVIAIGMDNGNDAIKLAMFTDQGELVVQRHPIAYQRAKEVQSGSLEVTYQMGYTNYWVGEVALRHDEQDIEPGPTDQRVVDLRWKHCAAASLVELLLAAGLQPGEHNIALGFAIPNNEIAMDSATNKLGVKKSTATALKAHVLGQSWTVKRTDPKGQQTEWSLHIRDVVPQAQSIGTYTVWSKAPSGKNMRGDYDGVVVIDIGGGDLQRTEITTNPYQIISERLDDGTITIAQSLASMFPSQTVTNVAAQHALITRRLMIDGKFRDVIAQVEEVTASDGQNVIGKVMASIRGSRRFVILTGGGVILLHHLIEQRFLSLPKKRGEGYEIINYGLASTVNGVGALFAMLFKAGSRKR